MDTDRDGKLSFNETSLNKATFNKIALDGYITVDDIKRVKARLEEELDRLLEMSTTTNSHIVTSSSEVQSVTMAILVTITSQPVISSPQAVGISSSDLPPLSSSLVVTSSSSTAVALKASPSRTESDSDYDDLVEAVGNLEEA